jgi:excisionase family DNA binding protein
MPYETKLRKIDMNAPADPETRRLLRILGETALRLSDGQPVERRWLEMQFSVAAPEVPLPVEAISGLLTVPEACAQLRISRWSLYRLMQQRRLNTVTIGRRRLIPQAEVDRFVVSLAGTGGAP